MKEVKQLQIGDTIGIVAPAGPCRKNIKKIISSIESYGYKTKMGVSCYLNYNGYLAGTDEIRAKDLEDMFLDKEVDAIMCLRGGYGTTRILELINYNIIKNNPKVFIGYSDITALHIAFNQICDLQTYHGTMASNAPEWDEFTYLSLIQSINFKSKLDIINPNNEEVYTLNEGLTEGKLIGGNLSLIVSTLGTKYEIDTKDKILFIEEVGESIYKLDRMLNHLYLANKFSDCRGIIFGDFTDCKRSSDEYIGIKELLIEVSKKVNKPALYNIKSGHCNPMITLPLNLPCSLNATNKKIEIRSDY